MVQHAFMQVVNWHCLHSPEALGAEIYSRVQGWGSNGLTLNHDVVCLLGYPVVPFSVYKVRVPEKLS